MLSQITTQEDVLFAGITVKQLVIWMVGFIALAAIYVAIPKPMQLNVFKGVPMLCVAGATAMSSVKYKGVLLLDHGLLRLKYTLRDTTITE